MANRYENIQDTFIDIKTGRAFNGLPPYTFRFDEQTSIGLLYVKQICFISKDETVEIKTPEDQTIFRPLAMTQDIPEHSIIKMNLNFYMDLNDEESPLIAPNNTFISTGYKYTTRYDVLPDQDNPGVPGDYFYVHMIYILGTAEDPGEYLETLYINSKEYLILGDFYAENEVLKENLKNLESKLPESIQKAIYENNVHEELADNILLNRKNKELLMEYINIMANKGSTASILNSINWFEWGDLLRLEEYWKRYINDDLDFDYFARCFDSLLTPEDIKQLSNHVKTTYLGLYCTLNHLQMVDGKVVYQDTFGRNNIQSMTSWEDRDASNRYAPLKYYEDHPELEPASIEPNTQEYEDALSAEIATEQPITWTQFIDPNNNPGITVPGTNTPGNWAYNEETGQWVEITPGNTGDFGEGWVFYQVNFNYLYSEQMPNLLRTLTLWTGQDLSLKMTVLGNFLSTFFLPIHINLLHSCIEYWVYSYGLKHIYSQMQEERSYMVSFGGLDMVWESTGKIEPHPEMNSWYSTIMFKNYSTENVFGYTDSYDEYEERLSSTDDPTRAQQNMDILQYYYKGESCKIRFIGRIDTGTQDENVSLYGQRLVWKDKETGVGEVVSQVGKNGEFVTILDAIPQYEAGHYVYIDDVETPITEGPGGNAFDCKIKRLDTYSKRYCIDLDFCIGVKKAGEYAFYFEFYTTNNRIYSKKFIINISDCVSNTLDVMRLEHIGKDDPILGTLNSPIELYQMMDVPNDIKSIYKEGDVYINKTQSGRDAILQSHYLSADPSSTSGLNHTLIGIVKYDYEFGDENSDVTIGAGDNILNVKNIISGASGNWEGEITRWVDSNNKSAVWSHNYWTQYEDGDLTWEELSARWPAEWGELNQERSEAMNNINIPPTIDNGKLNTLIQELEEMFPEYWWSWDRTQISDRDSLKVKDPIEDFDGESVYMNEGRIVKGSETQNIYPDNYPGN